MRLYIKIFTGIFLMNIFMFGSMAYAKTPDGETPAVESVCSDLDFEGKMFGICNAYCEAMDCDNPNHKASAKACHKKLNQWNKLADGQPLPCETEPGISLLKKVNGFNGMPSDNEITVGEEIVYTFEIVNSGNVALEDITVSDPTLGDENIFCPPDNEQPISLDLDMGESATCRTADGAFQAIEGIQENKAVVTGQSIYDEEVMAMSMTGYLGIEDPIIECPCVTTWTNDKPEGAPAITALIPGTLGAAGFAVVECRKPATVSEVMNTYTLELQGGNPNGPWLCADFNRPDFVDVIINIPFGAGDPEASIEACTAFLQDNGCS